MKLGGGGNFFKKGHFSEGGKVNFMFTPLKFTKNAWTPLERFYLEFTPPTFIGRFAKVFLKLFSSLV